MSQLNDDEKNRLFMTLDLHTKQNEKIERGLYGDRANSYKGALEQIEDLRVEIKGIKAIMHEKDLKSARIAGIVAGIIVCLRIGWEYLTK